MWENKIFLGGLLRLGPVTIYGRNGMHWAVSVHIKNKFIICFRLPFRCFGRWWPLYVYCSFNGTPQAAFWGIGREGYTWQDEGLSWWEWVTMNTRGYKIYREVAVLPNKEATDE